MPAAQTKAITWVTQGFYNHIVSRELQLCKIVTNCRNGQLPQSSTIIRLNLFVQGRVSSCNRCYGGINFLGTHPRRQDTICRISHFRPASAVLGQTEKMGNSLEGKFCALWWEDLKTQNQNFTNSEKLYAGKIFVFNVEYF